MKKLIIVIGSLLMMIVILLKCSAPTKSTAVAFLSTNLPPDCANLCTITAANFDKWFAGGAAKADSLVVPANSVGFSPNSNCDFYLWSEQMFLWLTSPLPTKDGGSVFGSSQFYDVSPAKDSIRTLTQHQPGMALTMSSHIEQTGPNRLPIVITKSGRLLEIENPAPVTNNKLSAVKNGAGSIVTIAKVKTNDKGVLEFFDGSGKVIDHPKALIHHKNQKGFVQKFTDGKTTVFLDDQGPVQTESGQDTGDVLMSQNGSLVYYLLTVNDMFAWYLKACKTDSIDATHFPTTPAARDSIVNYARAHGEKSSLRDSNTLAMEIKTSWVEASRLTDPQDYFTIKATIPNYDTTNTKLWTRKKNDTTVLMAMVGMHVVGSANQHGEMIWSTFEHQSNTPNTAYDYLDTTGKKIAVPADSGPWMFNSSGSMGTVNQSHMRNADSLKNVFDYIFAVKPFSISPSNTERIFAWGNKRNSAAPNPEDTSAAEANSKIISLNRAIRKLLIGDRRTNYLFIGATWTDPGSTRYGTPPNRHSYSTLPVRGSAVGTSNVANSTMETYIQLDTTSCLYCHSDHDLPPHTLPTLSPGALSHIFVDLIRGLNEAALPGKPKGLKAKRSSM